jgi:hypothetical protein
MGEFPNFAGFAIQAAQGGHEIDATRRSGVFEGRG